MVIRWPRNRRVSRLLIAWFGLRVVIESMGPRVVADRQGSSVRVLDRAGGLSAV